MRITLQIAKHFREVHFGGNWTSSNLKDQLSDVTWQQAINKVNSLNTVATLVFHISYYTDAVLKVLKGNQLEAHDKFSFDHPPINSKEDWEHLLSKLWHDAEEMTTLIAQLPDEKLLETFSDEKYGNYYRNLNGMIEHAHYHLGQIALIKKIINQNEKS